MANSISPDDQCGVCGTRREDHGDKQHQFNLEDILVPIQPGPKPSNTPPRARSAGVEQSPLEKDPVARLQIRMLERLTSKGLLDGSDLVYIFGGESAHS